jgi:hypothetical protein
MSALPLDVLRVLVGLHTLADCLRLIADVPHFRAPEGLMDQELSRELFPVSWQPLFPLALAGSSPLLATLVRVLFLARFPWRKLATVEPFQVVLHLWMNFLASLAVLGERYRLS